MLINFDYYNKHTSYAKIVQIERYGACSDC